MSISEATYRQIALEDPDGLWELHCGKLQPKPEMTFAHGNIVWDIVRSLFAQLDPATLLVSR